VTAALRAVVACRQSSAVTEAVTAGGTVTTLVQAIREQERRHARELFQRDCVSTSGGVPNGIAAL